MIPHYSKHPKELYVLALAELCERFSFWGTGFLLVLYLVGYYHVEDAKATTIYGIFSGCATFLPLIGGYLADRWNYQTPLLWGALVNAIGCFMLATGLSFLLYPALAIIACGYGLFTPSILAVLGYSYQRQPELRDAGFSIYYASINVGVFLALIILGFISQEVSWNAAFLTAALVQVVGIIPIVWFLVKHKEVHQTLHRLQKESRKEKAPFTQIEKSRIRVILIMGLFSIFFWIAYNQGYSSMSLFSKDFTNRSFLGWEVPPSWILSSEALFLVILAPILSSLYSFLRKKKIEFSAFAKSTLSFFAIAACFLVMMVGSSAIPLDARSASISAGYPIFAFFLMAVGEMLLMPIGLSLVTKLAPHRFTAFLVGFWYLCVGLAFYIGGTLAGLMEKLDQLSHFFAIFVILTLVPGLILLFFFRKLKQMAHLKD